MEDLEKAVTELYDLRDSYFERFPVTDASQKDTAVNAAAMATVQRITDFIGTSRINARLSFLKGKTLNVTGEYNKEAEEFLSKAVKLDPKMVEAWNALGECFWKKKELQSAKDCFMGALARLRNKESLCKLSMLLRQLDGTSAERSKNITESLTVAKEALTFDLNDGYSWFILGNAYLALFFANMDTAEHIRLATKAFKRADLDPTQVKNNPDLHQNYACLLDYQEDYVNAIARYQLASQLCPGWLTPIENIEKIQETCFKVHEHIQGQNVMKPKRVADLVAQLDSTSRYVPLKQLSLHANPGKVVEGKVVFQVRDHIAAQIFIVVDRESTWFCVTVYNMAPNVIKIEDTIVVPDPFFRPIFLEKSDKIATYPSIRVDDPTSVRINGRLLAEDKLSKSICKLTAKSD